MNFMFRLIIGMFFVLWPIHSQACQCLELALEDRVSNATAVLTGSVEDIVTLPQYIKDTLTDRPVMVRIKSVDVFKGASHLDKDGTIILYTNLQNITCSGHPFQVDESYLVFVYQRKQDAPEHWSLYNYPSETYGVGGRCGGTKNLKSDLATQDILELQSLKKRLRR